MDTELDNELERGNQWRLLMSSFNITCQFEKLYNWPGYKLKGIYNFIQEDENYFRFTDCEVSFSWYPEIIILSQKVILWNRGVVRASGSNEAERYAKHILELLGLKPLYDEDCPSIQICWNKEQEEEYEDIGFSAIFYFNPEFPEGFWENHSIPIQPFRIDL